MHVSTSHLAADIAIASMYSFVYKLLYSITHEHKFNRNNNHLLLLFFIYRVCAFFLSPKHTCRHRFYVYSRAKAIVEIFQLLIIRACIYFINKLRTEFVHTVRNYAAIGSQLIRDLYYIRVHIHLLLNEALAFSSSDFIRRTTNDYSYYSCTFLLLFLLLLLLYLFCTVSLFTHTLVFIIMIIHLMTKYSVQVHSSSITLVLFT